MVCPVVAFRLQWERVAEMRFQQDPARYGSCYLSSSQLPERAEMGRTNSDWTRGV